MVLLQLKSQFLDRLAPLYDAEEVARFPEQAPYFRFGFDAKDFQAKPGVALELLQLFSRDMT